MGKITLIISVLFAIFSDCYNYLDRKIYYIFYSLIILFQLIGMNRTFSVHYTDWEHILSKTNNFFELDSLIPESIFSKSFKKTIFE